MAEGHLPWGKTGHYIEVLISYLTYKQITTFLFIVPAETLEFLNGRTKITMGFCYRKLSTGDSNISLQYLFRVSNQAISNIVLETTHVIWKVLSMDHDIFEPPSEDQWLRVASEFEAMWDFPHCIGAVDGVHVHAKVSMLFTIHCHIYYWSSPNITVSLFLGICKNWLIVL